jgi:hypothetical protein
MDIDFFESLKKLDDNNIELIHTEEYFMFYSSEKYIDPIDNKQFNYVLGQNRYALGKKGNKPLLFIGINPSRATITKDGIFIDDQTIRRIENISIKNNYDSWIMLNIYPQRTPKTQYLHRQNNFNEKIHYENLSVINIFTNKYSVINAAWGFNIMKRQYLLNICFRGIVEKIKWENYEWYCNGITNENDYHPRHSSRIRTDDEIITKFCMEKYVNKYL